MGEISYKQSIIEAIQSFQSLSLREASIEFFRTLGYESQRTIDVLDGTPANFLKLLKDEGRDAFFNQRKAQFSKWYSIEMLFQLTTNDLTPQGVSGHVSADTSFLSSYLFFAVRLKSDDYPRSALSQIARQINRPFPMPVLVLFSWKERITLAIINRRAHKYTHGRQVLEKVSLIHNINIKQPHRGHIDSLFSFTKQGIEETQTVENFDRLQVAWESVFNVELLNKRFYQEIANWYFWACRVVRFPDDLEKDSGIRNATSVIRLLTRVIFCWFLKEKDLVPEHLFDKQYITALLRSLDDEQSTYYHAILQNLFFATLNQPMNTDSKPKNRYFVDDGDFQGNKKHYGIKTLYRYKEHFIEPERALDLFDKIPFLNGGLFTCLDIEEEGRPVHYGDGFSRNPKKQAYVPNELFFSPTFEMDLSTEYGDNRRKPDRVCGLLEILKRYKFTIAENTPVEEEIALDPELLGRIFENLLAAFNPETGETARKQTGSFYTPRTLVDYMVDESIKAYLLDILCTKFSKTPTNTHQERLDELFTYNDEPVDFSRSEISALLDAIDKFKVLDPACGSGAFPMGVLHKLVFILGKLDPDNELWKQKQLAHILSPQIRRELEATLKKNNDDYGRKLFLIQRCIFGIDIQTIAIQITKLRFFITLICEQRTIKLDRENNYNIRALPNLETKFVAADTLLSLPRKQKQSELFADPKIRELEQQLSEIRREYFAAQTRKDKLKWIEQDKKCRVELVELLNHGNLFDDGASSKQLASWDPYHPYNVADFFEAEWMFGEEVSEGFDLVIGNPPYVQIQKLTKEQKQLLSAQDFVTYAATADLYCLFYERGIQLLRDGGHLCYITSNKWMRAGYGEKLRDYLATKFDTKAVMDFGMAQNFSAATTYTNVLLGAKCLPSENLLACYAKDTRPAMENPALYFQHHAVELPAPSHEPWVILTPERQNIKNQVEAQGTPLKDWDIQINYGIKTGFNEAFYITQKQRDEFVAADPRCADYLAPLLRGRFVERYGTRWDGTWMIKTFPSLKLEWADLPNIIQKHLESYKVSLEPKPPKYKGASWEGRKAGAYRWFETQDTIAYHKEFSKPKIIYPNMTKYLPFYLDDEGQFYGNQKCFIVTSKTNALYCLLAILNSSLFRCCFKDNFPELLGNTYELSKIFFDKIPIQKPKTEEEALFRMLVGLVQSAKRWDEGEHEEIWSWWEEVIDACVMELYFGDYMAQQGIEVLVEVRRLLSNVKNFSRLDDESRWELARTLYEVGCKKKHPLGKQLLKLREDKGTLQIIREEGKV